jgi:hypothetical protein
MSSYADYFHLLLLFHIYILHLTRKLIWLVLLYTAKICLMKGMIFLL